MNVAGPDKSERGTGKEAWRFSPVILDSPAPLPIHGGKWSASCIQYQRGKEERHHFLSEVKTEFGESEGGGRRRSL